MEIASFFTSFSIPALGFNWIDILIFIIIIFYAIEGYSLGFLYSFIDLITFALSFILGITFYSFFGSFLVKTFSISQGFANAIGFFIAAALFEIILNFVLKSLVLSLPLFDKEVLKDKTVKRINKVLGIIPGFLSALIIISFILSLIISLPFSVFLKHSISNSKIGNVLVASTQGFAKDWSNVFGGAVNDTLSFLTVETKSNNSVKLNFKTSKISVDYTAEQEMFVLLNKERTKRNLQSVTFSENLAKVGRAHCQDMFERGYFSHFTLEGLSPFDRMAKGDITFNYAGENLALAPNVELAMKGFMQSEGHKANILSQNFNRVGIGVVDGEVYGQMYCQEFTD